VASFRSYEHLLRLAAVFAAGAAVFAVLRALLVPADYGVIGPFRAGAITANMAPAAVHAGQAACGECHVDVAEIRQSNAHARVACESCHGARASHAADPSVTAAPLDARATCAVCHLPNAAKPPGFKTVTFADHAGDETCTTCHAAHAPRL
jgi:hypothetical protein